MTAQRNFQRLTDLLDVHITSVQDGEVVAYDSGEAKFTNQAGGGGSSSSVAVVSEGTAALSYDGDTTMVATIHYTNTEGNKLTLVCSDDLSSEVVGYTDPSGNLVLTVNNIGWDPGDGPDFIAVVRSVAAASGLLNESFVFGVARDVTVDVLRPVLTADPITGVVGQGIGLVAPAPNSNPFQIFAANEQASALIEVWDKTGFSSLFRIGADGTPHFHGAGVPEVPASPAAQDVVDALLALGLVTQAP